jgi:hypothetical protein
LQLSLIGAGAGGERATIQQVRAEFFGAYDGGAGRGVGFGPSV